MTSGKRFDLDTPIDEFDRPAAPASPWQKALIAAGIVGAIAAVVFFISSKNAQRWLITKEGQSIVVKRGEFSPGGFRTVKRYPAIAISKALHALEFKNFADKYCDSSKEVEVQLFAIYTKLAGAYLHRQYDRQIARRAAFRLGRLALKHATALSQLPAKKLKTLDSLLLKFHLAEARYHLNNSRDLSEKQWPVVLNLAKDALYDSLRLRKLGSKDRETIDNLLGDIYYLEGKLILIQVGSQLRLARSHFRKAHRKESETYRDSAQWIRFIDSRIGAFKGLNNPFRKPLKPLKALPLTEQQPLTADIQQPMLPPMAPRLPEPETRRAPVFSATKQPTPESRPASPTPNAPQPAEPMPNNVQRTEPGVEKQTSRPMRRAGEMPALSHPPLSKVRHQRAPDTPEK